MDDVILTLQADKVRENMRNNHRDDGRAIDQFRPLSIVRNISKNAESSVAVKLGKTEVYCGIKILPGDAYPDSPGQGSISVGVEMGQMASPEFESGPPSPLSIEMSRVVDRGIRESHCVDFSSLAIPGTEKVWIVWIDLYPVNDDGNLFDACGLAALAALADAKFPKFEDNAIVPKEFDGQIELANKPILVTAYKIGNRMVLDPTRGEEKAATARFSVTCTEDGHYSAFQKGLGDSLTGAEVEQSLDWAMEKSKELRRQLFEG
jgi:exosome complex component RRP42